MSDSNWDAWPTCPQCGRRRQTVCSMCGTAGIEFDLAEFLAPPDPVRETRTDGQVSETPGEALKVLLMCPQCDEAFSPQFYRRCAECGFDFGEGIEVTQREPTPISPRVTLVILATVAVCVGLLGYFWWLLR